ncbi:putative nucleic acid-binding protein [Microbacteriaceae bacterium SG_E_30_P1]|uniref:Ribonuclease VapC n=1 Tax=Antiquaquibacter oligotrophicus TaxID=2880260 RepID=A0ABT6KQP7_9MICO|nr:PIN domain-containing protein [Antiquaquibacter oligotrophicus]MDH6181517.1 putative nucleic acid-binding protein [Antiquaquibacter oligotrophicus]UDF12793.1 PIN domain-containing protein [Antiquaquibacter oligotrophicus]
MILDTSVLLSYLDRNEPAHDRATALIDTYRGSLVVSPLVLAEVDYLLLTRGGLDAEIAGMRELASGAWEIASFTSEDLLDALGVVERYPALAVGATDASLVVLAHRYGTRTIATLDRRHFEVLRSLDGKPFDVVPG